MLQDTYGGPAYYWYIDENHTADLLEDVGEVNMGSYQTLSDFISYGKEFFPADRYLLSFYDHGGGWQGVCWDDTSNDHLTMDEVQTALASTGGVDVICHTAPCLMGAFESVYELRECVDVYIGSEEGSGYAWWGYIISDICDMLEEDSDIDTITLGEQIIDVIWEDHDRWEYKEAITMSAIRTDKMEDLALSLDILAQNFLTHVNSSFEKIRSIYDDVQYFSSGGILDIYDFAERYRQVESDQHVYEDASTVMQCLTESVISECHGSDHPDAHGLTIYLPSDSLSSEYANPSYGLDFSNDTVWDEFITLFNQELLEPGVDQYQTEMTTGMVICSLFTWAQSFIPSKEPLKKVHLKLSRLGSITSDLTVSIRHDKEGGDLTETSIPYDRVPKNGYEWIPFNFPDIIVTPGETYYLLLSTDGGDNTANCYLWSGSGNAESYPQGDVWIHWSSNDQWRLWDPPIDACFKTFFEERSLTPPLIHGPVSGQVGIEYPYTFVSDDPNDLDVFYYIDWGDGTTEEWAGPFESGKEVTFNHTWNEKGSYLLKAKAKNTENEESEWSILEIYQPKLKSHFHLLLQRFLGKHPLLFSVLRNVLSV